MFIKLIKTEIKSKLSLNFNAINLDEVTNESSLNQIDDSTLNMDDTPVE